MKRVWSWLREPGMFWFLAGCLFVTSGVVDVVTGKDAVADSALAVACFATGRLAMVEAVLHDQTHIIIALLKERAMERQRQNAG
jgi:hypothetical protein